MSLAVPGPDAQPRRAMLAVCLCGTAYLLDGADVVAMSYVAPALGRDWSLAPQALGLLFGAGFAGMMLGGLAVAPAGDIVGRRRMIVVALAVMGTGMVASGLAGGVAVLLALRLLVGVGLGTLVATASALASESVADRDRLTAVAIVQSGYPLGSILLGIAAVWTIPAFGWRGTLILPGIATLAFVPVAALLLPEGRALRRGATARSRDLLGAMVRDGRGASTTRLWGASFACSLSLFFVLSWLPKLAVELGRGATGATLVATAYNVGAWLGTLAMAAGVRRAAPPLVVATMLAAAAALFPGIAASAATLPTMTLAALLAGCCVQGGYNGIPGLASSLYPADARSTGIGWAIGIGRAGAVAGPLVAGALLGAGMRPSLVFPVFAVPLATAALLLRGLRLPTRPGAPRSIPVPTGRS